MCDHQIMAAWVSFRSQKIHKRYCAEGVILKGWLRSDAPQKKQKAGWTPSLSPALLQPLLPVSYIAPWASFRSSKIYERHYTYSVNLKGDYGPALCRKSK